MSNMGQPPDLTSFRGGGHELDRIGLNLVGTTDRGVGIRLLGNERRSRRATRRTETTVRDYHSRDRRLMSRRTKN